MHLVWFLTIGAILSIILGEFGQYPFGSTTFSLSVTDFFTGMLLVLLFIWQVQTRTLPRKLPRFMWYFFGFWFICGLSLLVSLNFSGTAYLLRFLLYSSVVYLGYSVVHAKVASFQNIVKAIFLSGIVLSFLGFLQLLLYPDLEPLFRFGYDPHKNRLFSTLLDPNLVGIYLNISLLSGLFLYWKYKGYITLGFVILIGLAILLTFSRSAFLTSVVSLFIFFTFYSKKILVGIIIFGLLATLFVPKVQQRIIGALKVDTSASERIVSWQNGLYLISQRPLLGVGFNNIRSSQIEHQLLRTNQTETVNSGSGLDSSLLFVGATTGIVGLIGFISLFFYYISQLVLYLKTENRLIAVCLLSLSFGIVIGSQFVNALFFTPIMFVFYLLMGAFFATAERK